MTAGNDSVRHSNCPECGSYSIEGGSFEFGDGYLIQTDMSCNDCRTTWDDVYTLHIRCNVTRGGDSG